MHFERKYQIINALNVPALTRRDRRIHFMHIAKCGGTTLRFILEGYASLNGLRSVNEARRVCGVIPELTGGDVVMGHRRTADLLTRPDTCYITVLRDPVSRLRSLVQMHMARFGRPSADLVRELRWVDANPVVHMLTGATDATGDPTADAIRALEDQVHLFGFQEKFEELMALVATMLGVGGIIDPRFQKAAPDHLLDQRHDSQFADLSQADARLFAFAQVFYESRWRTTLANNDIGKVSTEHPYMAVTVNEETETVDVSSVYLRN